jgi:ribose transport system permease protein
MAEASEIRETVADSGRFGGIWIATGVLFLASWFIAPGTLSARAIFSMLPFAAILAVAAVGSTLVIQQRGIDLSVAGIISLAAVIATKMPTGGAVPLWVGIAVAVSACIILGAVTGVFVTRFRVTPLIATLAMNAIILGIIRTYSAGSPSGADPTLATFALQKTFGIPNTVLVATAVVIAVAFVSTRTVAGRNFIAIGSTPRAARAVGLRVTSYQIGTYAIAGACYAIAGVLLAGYVNTPGLDAGDTYLFAAISAVIIGGTPLTGGKGSVVASAVAALFLSQLVSLVLSVGAPTSIQWIVQAMAIAVATILRDVRPRRRGRTGTTGPPRDLYPSEPAPAGGTAP